MKKVSLILVGGAIALGSLFTSCKKDKVAPAISTVTVGTTAITKDGDTAKVEAGSVVAIAWAVTKGDNDFKSLTVRIGTEDDTIVTDAAKIAVGGYAGEFVAGVYNVKVVVADKDGLESSRSFVVKATATTTAPEINTFAAATLGAQNAAEGGFYSITDGSVIMGSNAAANTDKIYITIADLGATGSVKTKLLSYAFRADVSTGLDASKVPATAKKTYFKKVTGVDFATATKTELAALTVATTDAQIVEIAQGDVIAFITETGKKGLISIKTYTNLAPTLKSTASIEVKIQK